MLDTSVVIKWFSEYDEDDLEAALTLRGQLIEGKSSAVIPDLLFYELSNALRYNPRFGEGDVKEACKSVRDMGFDVRGAEDTIMELAVAMAFRHDVTVYDAYFLALSRIEGRPLVTADYRFTGRLKGAKNVIRLADIV